MRRDKKLALVQFEDSLESGHHARVGRHAAQKGHGPLKGLSLANGGLEAARKSHAQAGGDFVHRRGDLLKVDHV